MDEQDPPAERPGDADAAPEHDLNPLQRLMQQRLRERGWSYDDVARRGGTSHSTIHTLATTRNLARPPRPAKMAALAEGLDLPVSAIRAAAAESTGLHYYDDVLAGREDPDGGDRQLLIASIDELAPEDRRYVAALSGSLAVFFGAGYPPGGTAPMPVAEQARHDADPHRRESPIRAATILVPRPDRERRKLRAAPGRLSPAFRRNDLDHWATWGAARDGAYVLLTMWQKCILLLLTAAAVTLLAVMTRDVLIAALAVITALYVVTGVYKVWLLVRGEHAASRRGLVTAPAAEDELPMYTVLVPLRSEGKILPVLLERLKAIDYPADRLEILLLIEADDEETQLAVRECTLGASITPVIAPPGQPRTKPRALNIGLHEARGDYLVIYDAEDQPDHDQLRKAAAMFATMPADVVCLQARLNFYNPAQSTLTRLFAVDYAAWYDQMLPGLAEIRRPRSGQFIPLGGTSNHLRVETLRELGGWDPFNVTEDCDLGTRLGRAGLKVAMLDSVTWEEAVPRIRPWIRQRSRWIKGYIQTYLVHMRDPLRLLRQLGPRGFTDFQLLVGLSSAILLLNPVMWALTALYSATAGTAVARFIQTLFPPPLYYLSLLCLVIGNFVFFYCNAYVCVRHDYISLTRYALLTPLYWLLLSIGAWAGVLSLIRRPYYWAKTEHGVSLTHIDTPVAARSD